MCLILVYFSVLSSLYSVRVISSFKTPLVVWVFIYELRAYTMSYARITYNYKNTKCWHSKPFSIEFHTYCFDRQYSKKRKGLDSYINVILVKLSNTH